MGGYVAGSAAFVDMIRSYAPGFIFTTSLPPGTVAGALASVRYLRKSSVEREQQQANARALKGRLAQVGIPVLSNPSHIVPVMVYDAELCKRCAPERRKIAKQSRAAKRFGGFDICGYLPSPRRTSDRLLVEYGIYTQAINYPTVPVGTERLRITPGPMHTPAMMDHLVESLVDVWHKDRVRGRFAPGCSSKLPGTHTFGGVLSASGAGRPQLLRTFTPVTSEQRPQTAEPIVAAAA